VKKHMMHALLERMNPATEAERKRMEESQRSSGKSGLKFKRKKGDAAGGQK
jgi:hypothetical protein